MANDITENEYLLFAFFKTTDNLINSLVSFGQEGITNEESFLFVIC